MITADALGEAQVHVTSAKTAFVFAGGGSLGAVQVGMLRAIVSHGLRADLIVGASVGAINGAFFAGTPTLDGVSQLEQLWLGVKRRDIFPMTLERVFAFLHQSDFLVDPSGLRALLDRHLPCRHLEEATIPIHVVATDLLNGQPVVLSTGATVAAVLASTAIPVVFPPVRLGEHYLIDGAIASATPVIAALELGATRIIVFPAGFSCRVERIPRGMIANALNALNLLVSRQLGRDIAAIRSMSERGANVNVVMVPPLCPLSVSSYDFSRTSELIEAAATNTQNWLQKGGMTCGALENWLNTRIGCPFCNELRGLSVTTV
jgi:NTE family protein